MLTVSLNRLVTRFFLSISFSFSLSGSLSVLVGGGSAGVPNIASSWAACTCSSLLAYVTIWNSVFQTMIRHVHQRGTKLLFKDTWTAENLKLWPMCLTKDASSSATADGRRVQSVRLCSKKSITTNFHYKHIYLKTPSFNNGKVGSLNKNI